MRNPILFAVVVALLLIIQFTPAVTAQEDEPFVIDSHYRVPIYVDLGSGFDSETGDPIILTLMIDLETATVIRGGEPLSTTIQSVVVEVDPDNDPLLIDKVFVDVGPTVTSTVASRVAAAIPTEVAPIPTVCKNANLRSGPGLKFGVIGSAKAGTELKLVLQESDGQGRVWYQLEDGSWISGSLVCNAPSLAPVKEPATTNQSTAQAEGAGAASAESATETASKPCEPGLELSSVPAYGTESNLRGRVSLDCVNPDEFNVVVFIYVEGAGWWIKPSLAEPRTSIQRDGSWSADIVTGGSDQFATKIAAFLLPASYNPPLVAGLELLPQELYDNAATSIETTRNQPSVESAPAEQPISGDASITMQVDGSTVRGTVFPESVCNRNFKIALYARTNHWWVQPFADERRNVRINDDCSWETTTNDWLQLAAHLVTADYQIEPELFSESACPPYPLDPAGVSGVIAAVCYP